MDVNGVYKPTSKWGTILYGPTNNFVDGFIGPTNHDFDGFMARKTFCLLIYLMITN